MTFDEYVQYVGAPENVAREPSGGWASSAGTSAAPSRRSGRVRLRDAQAAAIQWPADQPDGPARIFVISEQWPSDYRRDVPVLRSSYPYTPTGAMLLSNES